MIGLPSREDRALEKFRSQIDADIFGRICALLRNSAPKNSEIMVLEVAVPKDVESADAFKMADYSSYQIKGSAKNSNFVLDDAAKLNILEELLNLRKNMESGKSEMAKIRGRWKHIKLLVDVPMNKYSADFKY